MVSNIELDWLEDPVLETNNFIMYMYTTISDTSLVSL